MSEPVMAYRGICEHGKVRAVSVDRPDLKKYTAKDVAEWVKYGLKIDRVTVEEARKSDWNCEPCDAKRPLSNSKEPQ